METKTDDLIEAQKKLVESQPHLAIQDISHNIEMMTPLTPEIISRQATINIGTIGHVAHGKSTLVRAISGVNVHIFLLTLHLLFRPLDITKSVSGISLLSWATRTQSSTNAQLASLQSASSPSAPRWRTRPNAPLPAATPLSNSSGTCLSSTVQVTMCSWPQCLPALQSWTQRYFLSQEINHARSHKPVNTWLQSRS